MGFQVVWVHCFVQGYAVLLHVEQLPALAPPQPDLNEPVRQFVQGSQLFAFPLAVVKVPVGHAVHTPAFAAEKNPALHGVQVVASTAAAVPAAHPPQFEGPRVLGKPDGIYPALHWYLQLGNCP